MTSTPTYVTRAAQGLLRALKAKGQHAESIDDAITKGLLTDLEWCAALDAYRPQHNPRRLPFHIVPKSHGRRQW